MEFYVALNGDSLEFQKKKPVTGEYVEFLEEDDYEYPPWLQYKAEVKSIRFLDPISPISTAGWFYNFYKLESFNKKNLDLSQTITLQKMFGTCYSLRCLDLSGLDISVVRDLSELFVGCASLSEIDLSGWDTSNVEDFHSMFAYCYSLSHLDISSFSMQSAKTLDSLCSGDEKLQSIKFPKFTNNTFTVQIMLDNCISLQKLDISNFGHLDDSRAQGMLSGCYSLSNIQVSKENLGQLQELLDL